MSGKIFKHNHRLVLLAPALLSLGTAGLFWLKPAQTMAQGPYASTISESVQAPRLLIESSLPQSLEAGKIENIEFYNAAAMRDFYETRNHAPFWLQGYGRRHVKASIVLEAIENSWKHGLNPEEYHVGTIQKLLDKPFGTNRGSLELLLSDAVIRYGRDMTGMRVDPKAIRQKSKYWRQPMGASEILEHFEGSPNTRTAFQDIEPQGNLYKALQDELIALLKEPAPEYEQYLPISLNGILRPGDGHKKVAEIRRRMGQQDDAPRGQYYYDDALASKVMALQKHYKLEADGVIGPKTIKVMNLKRADKVMQVIANLERLRWTDRVKPDRYVLVNIPSQKLWAVENNNVALEMDVIVGKKGRSTNSFTTEITGVRFNPNWTIPPTIKRVDFLPKLRNDPYYASNRGIELIKGYGRNARTLDPASIDWSNISWRELNKIRMVQGPGARNPLGRVRIIMENPYNIYLHDTDKPHYFKKTDRTLSSGCVRVSKPEELAQFIMKNEEDWSTNDTKRLINTGKLTERYINDPIPVYILYQTIWQDDAGELVFGTDVYGRDKRLIKALKAQNSVHIPEMPVQHAQTSEKTGVEYANLNP